ncbi:hypothetical protein XH91_27660 [Bradyrhizobium guangzhouense]|uniref:Uncharacterized protein n=1 Tax=Bradyrhizobium guangzhouense TaxID=1325095 RepID=A0AAE5X4I3_9BRAD|nr:hypothetical protein XH91_27660 [Bradyrhizobium guangzhouense]
MNCIFPMLARACLALAVSSVALFEVDGRLAAQAQLSNLRSQLQDPAEGLGSAPVRDALNRPCLEAAGVSRPHTVNPDLVDHLVRLENRCPRVLKLKVCYFTEDHCKALDLGAYKTEEVFLGMMTKVSRFKFFIFQK